ncbi:uncharacterized protein LOC144350791 [Saccoglossus kowalevskii]
MSRTLIIAVCIAVTLGGGCCQEGCPTNLDDTFYLQTWSIDVYTNCSKQLIDELRQNTDNCSAKVQNVEVCMNQILQNCTTDMGNNNQMRQHLEASVNPYLLSAVDRYNTIYCTEGGADIPNIIPIIGNIKCDYGIQQPSMACGDDFMEMFKNNPLNETLCSAYEEMVICQTDLLDQYCPDMSEEERFNDDSLRKRRNIFCADEDSDESKNAYVSDTAAPLFRISLFKVIWSYFMAIYCIF